MDNKEIGWHGKRLGELRQIEKAGCRRLVREQMIELKAIEAYSLQQSG